MDKEYCLIIDTNVFRIQELNDYSTPYLFGRIRDLIKKLEINDIIDKIDVCIPQVVLMESLKHQDERYENEFNKFMGKSYPLFVPKKKEKYMEWLKKDFYQKLKDNNYFDGNVKILDYPKSSSFKAIVKRAIFKNDPFEGNNGKNESDKGFKDALIWHTLLEYKTINKNQKIILYSTDSKLTSEYCKTEFKQLFSEDLIVAKKGQVPEFDDVLKQLFSLDKIELSLEDRIKKELRLKLEKLDFSFLLGKTVYTPMGESFVIDQMDSPNISIGGIILNKEFKKEEDNFIGILVLINITVYGGETSKGTPAFIQNLEAYMLIWYDVVNKKFIIKAANPIHKDINENDYRNMLKFIEE